MFLLNPYRYASAGGSFSPTDVAGLERWYDAQDSGTITSSGGTVSQWDDKSGNNYHIAAPTSSDEPATGGSINGNDALDFSAGDKFLKQNGTDGVPNGDDQPFTVFAVVKQEGSATDGRPWGFGDQDTGANDRHFLRYESGEWKSQRNSDKQAASGSSGDTNGHLIALIFTGTSVSLREDGSEILADTAQDTGALNSLDIFTVGALVTGLGTFDAWDGLIGEVLVYDSAIGGSDLTDIESYLMNRWGIS